MRLRDSLLGDDVELDADLVVLAVGMVPNSADGEAIRDLRDAKRRVEKGEVRDAARRGGARSSRSSAHHEGTEILNLDYRQGPDLPVLRYGFPDSHFICFPYETRRTGIYAAGTVRAPMDAAQAAEDGWGAAMKAVQCIEALSRRRGRSPALGRHRRSRLLPAALHAVQALHRGVPVRHAQRGREGHAAVQPAALPPLRHLHGRLPGADHHLPGLLRRRASPSMIKAMSVPEEFEEKPRIVALLCENDALPALDAAARSGAQWNPWVRIIPVRCLGSINIVWIADSLSRGIDGVILIGCKHGDDYQCHYIRGSELAGYRLGNVQETLTRLAARARAGQGRGAGPRRVRRGSRRSSTSSPRSSTSWVPTR